MHFITAAYWETWLEQSYFQSFKGFNNTHCDEWKYVLCVPRAVSAETDFLHNIVNVLNCHKSAHRDARKCDTH